MRAGIQRILLIGMVGLMGFNLGGCEQKPDANAILEAKLHPVKIMPLYESKDSILAQTGTPLQGAAPIPAIGDVVPETSFIPGEKQKATYNPNYILFADVYWKLNWMRKELLRGLAPYNLLQAVNKAQQELQPAPRDGNYDAASEALDHVRKGLEHLACLHTLQKAHIDDLRVPWGTGVSMVQRSLNSDLPAAPAPKSSASPDHSINLLDGDFDTEPAAPAPSSIPSSPDTDTRHPTPDTLLSGPTSASDIQQSQAVQLALDYEQRYHASPREMIRREWERAILATNRLRDQLHLANRPENSDGDSADVSTAVAQAALSEVAIPTPEGAGKSVPAEVETYGPH